MKKILTLLLVGASILVFSQNTIKVMSYNIRLSLESDKENSWDNRKSETLALMNYYHPDVMGVQEAVPQQMTEMNNYLKDYSSVGVGRDDGANKGEYSAIFFDKNKFKLITSGTFWLSETPEKPSKGWDAALNRICTYALLKSIKGGKKIWVFNTHFDHIGVEARKNSAKLILKKVREFNTENLPVVVMGDFNLTETEEPVKILSAAMDDTFYKSEKPHYGPKATFQAFDVATPAKNRIDYIFVKGLKSISNRTINDRRENLLYPSDHFPILAEIRL